MATPPPLPGQRLPFQTVVNQAPSHVTNVYVGNLSPDTTGKKMDEWSRKVFFIHPH